MLRRSTRPSGLRSPPLRAAGPATVFTYFLKTAHSINRARGTMSSVAVQQDHSAIVFVEGARAGGAVGGTAAAALGPPAAHAAAVVCE
jgi:hypothetical protein